MPGRSAPRLTGLHRPRLGTAGRSPKRGLRGESLRIGLYAIGSGKARFRNFTYQGKV